MESRQYRHLVKRVCMVLPFCLFTFLPLSAQTTFTQKVQQTKQGEGTVTIHQDAAIDELVNEPQPVKQTPAPRPAPTPKKDDKPSGNSGQKTDTAEAKQPTQTPDTTVVVNTGKPFKTTGYRVQVFAGGNTRKDKQKAEQTGHSLEQLFPNDAVYVHFYSPRWICRIGNYRTYEEAHAMMMEIRQLGYTSATIVRGKIIATQ